ncbi:MAG TPA: gamma-glutamylcyclotransferase family protein [Dehalococcoidia bacterium]|nr:gamma-glutamylcyclotransferase family protein [Dehalococcoidia bacterium]
MTAREPEPTTLYFAYGSNLDGEHMAQLCPGAEAIATARAEGYRFRINQAGYATLVPEEGATAYGLVWRVTPDHRRALDWYEEVEAGLYVPEIIEVELRDSAAERSLVYIATDSTPGVPAIAYMQGILRAARALGFPGSYVAELASWRPGQ